MAILPESKVTSLIFLPGNMNKIRREVLICYDVTNSKNRSALYEQLCDLGLRSIQKSVFWGFVNKAEKCLIDDLFKKYLDKTTDRGLLAFTNIAGSSENNYFGHRDDDFKEWDEYGCL